MENKLEYIKKIIYPEYADDKRINGKISASLLDLSVDDGQIIDEKIFELLELGLISASKYAGSQNPMLLEGIAEYIGVKPENIVITAGGDGGLRLISQALIEEGGRVCIPLPSFGRFEYHAKVNKGDISYIEPQLFPYDISYDQVLSYCNNTETEVIFLANPNNPTGIYKPIDKLDLLLKSFKGYLILDEVLGDYVEAPSAATLISKHPKLIIVKSFSKLFGLAGMRIGYVVASAELTDVFKVLTSPFEVNSVAIQLSIKLLADRRELLSKRRLDLLESLKKIWSFKNDILHFSPTQSSTFVMKSDSTVDLFGLLLNSGVKTVSGRSFRGIENENCVRVSLKSKNQASVLVNKFTEITKYL